MKIKIAFCKTTLTGPVSGADEIMVNYATHLHEAGHDVRVALLYPPASDDQFLRRLNAHGVPVTILVTRSVLLKWLRALRSMFSSVLFFLFFLRHAPNQLRKIWQLALAVISHFHYRECRAYFRKERPDVIHVFTPDTGALMMIRAGHEAHIPVLYHEMGTAHHMPMLRDYYRKLEKALPLCTEFAALSPSLAEEWAIRFPFLSSISVLPLIMERSRTYDFGESLTRPEEIVFGFAARIEEGKGPDVLLDALAEVNRQQSIAIARIAGIGPDLADIKARAHELALGEACEFVGFYSEPLGRTAFMSSLDVLVHPSRAEGTPNSVVEAMACGKPVIASAVGGIPDMIGDDAGLLVSPGDANELASAMLRLARDPELRQQMGNAARERYSRLFSPTAVTPLMLETYRRVVNNGNGHVEKTGDPTQAHPWASFQNNGDNAGNAGVPARSFREEKSGPGSVESAA